MRGFHFYTADGIWGTASFAWLFAFKVTELEITGYGSTVEVIYSGCAFYVLHMGSAIIKSSVYSKSIQSWLVLIGYESQNVVT